MNKSAVLVLILVVGLGLLLAVGAEPPSLDELENLASRGPLSREDLGKITHYIEHWISKLKAAKEGKDLIEAKTALIDGYAANGNVYYRLAYARVMADRTAVALSAKWSPANHVNLAMAAASMGQITIQPALEAMAVHDNPAVRYWAAIGYARQDDPAGQSLMKRLLSQGGEHSEKVLATLERLGLSEASGPVVAMALKTASKYYDLETGHAETLKAVFDKVWLARCQDVYAGQVEVIEAYSRAVRYPRAAIKAEQKFALQVLVDALEAASLAYYKDERKREGPRGQAYVELMIGIERRLAQVTGTKDRPITTILDNPKENAADKSVQVRFKVNKYWKEELLEKHWGVKVRFKPAPPTTAPATAPASAPAGATAPAAVAG